MKKFFNYDDIFVRLCEIGHCAVVVFLCVGSSIIFVLCCQKLIK